MEKLRQTEVVLTELSAVHACHKCLRKGQPRREPDRCGREDTLDRLHGAAGA